MTVQELYQSIGGDYEQVIRVLRMDKLVDKHIRKLTSNGVIESLLAAGQEMDPTALFETSHAVKGVCANLGLTELAAAASEISEEFRPGNPRRLSDAEVAERLDRIGDIYRKTAEKVRQYAEG